MIIRFLLTGLITIFVLITSAQDLISTGGDFFHMESGSISFTIGEPIIETLGNEDHDLTQGFQQASRDITTDYNEMEFTSINVFPNPTTDYINIECSEFEELNYQLYTLNGVLVSLGEISKIESTISLVNYNPSIFILKLYKEDFGSRTFQIVKK